MQRPPAPEAPAPAPLGLIEFIWRAWALVFLGPMRVAQGMGREVPIPDSGVQIAHINTSGKPTWVEIRVVPGAPAPVIFVSGQQTCAVEQSQSVNLAAEVYRGVTYPSERLFVKQQVNAPTRVIVVEVTL